MKTKTLNETGNANNDKAGVMGSKNLCAWVSVKEHRPEIGTIVILTLKHSKEDVYAGFRANGGWYCYRIGKDCKQYIPNGIKEAEITHWMPLPKSPSEGR